MPLTRHASHEKPFSSQMNQLSERWKKLRELANMIDPVPALSYAPSASLASTDIQRYKTSL